MTNGSNRSLCARAIAISRGPNLCTKLRKSACEILVLVELEEMTKSTIDWNVLKKKKKKRYEHSIENNDISIEGG